MIRVARGTDGTVGLAREGRGAYVCRAATCISAAIQRKAFGRALRVEASSVDWAELETELLREITDSNVES